MLLPRDHLLIIISWNGTSNIVVLCRWRYKMCCDSYQHGLFKHFGSLPAKRRNFFNISVIICPKLHCWFQKFHSFGGFLRNLNKQNLRWLSRNVERSGIGDAIEDDKRCSSNIQPISMQKLPWSIIKCKMSFHKVFFHIHKVSAAYTG